MTATIIQRTTNSTIAMQHFVFRART